MLTVLGLAEYSMKFFCWNLFNYVHMNKFLSSFLSAYISVLGVFSGQCWFKKIIAGSYHFNDFFKFHTCIRGIFLIGQSLFNSIYNSNFFYECLFQHWLSVETYNSLLLFWMIKITHDSKSEFHHNFFLSS